MSKQPGHIMPFSRPAAQTGGIIQDYLGLASRFTYFFDGLLARSDQPCKLTQSSDRNTGVLGKQTLTFGNLLFTFKID